MIELETVDVVDMFEMGEDVAERAMVTKLLHEIVGSALDRVDVEETRDFSFKLPAILIRGNGNKSDRVLQVEVER